MEQQRRTDYLPLMTRKVSTTKRSGRTGQFVEVRSDRKGRSAVIFGSVKILGSKPDRATVKINVDRSTQALARATRKLTNPGVVIREKKGVPQFSVVEDETGLFVRKLDGKTDRGRFVNGQFQVLE